mgnify:CR=1 FL=1
MSAETRKRVDYRRTCVEAKDGRWCALVNRPDPDAVHDLLWCGYWMNLRGHTEYRTTTCPECRNAIRGTGEPGRISAISVDTRTDP